MNCRFFSFLAAIAVALSLLGGCASDPAYRTTGIIGESGAVHTFQGRPTADHIVGVQFRLPRECAGRVLQLNVEYRTDNVGPGWKSYHGVHIDYEVFLPGGTPAYPSDWQVAASSEWRAVQRIWAIPADATSAMLRIGLQGVGGTLQVRNIRIAGCVPAERVVIHTGL